MYMVNYNLLLNILNNFDFDFVGVDFEIIIHKHN